MANRERRLAWKHRRRVRGAAVVIGAHTAAPGRRRPGGKPNGAGPVAMGMRSWAKKKTRGVGFVLFSTCRQFSETCDVATMAESVLPLCVSGREDACLVRAVSTSCQRAIELWLLHDWKRSGRRKRWCKFLVNAVEDARDALLQAGVAARRGAENSHAAKKLNHELTQGLALGVRVDFSDASGREALTPDPN